jgi:chorismate--pyruvate lyase
VNRWLAHVAAVHSAPALRDWLLAPGSMTERLRAHCLRFDVRVLRQGNAVCLADQASVIGLARPVRVVEREVLLVCDGIPVVYAQTVVPARCSGAAWPFLHALGSRSLGSALFGDPRIARSALQQARLSAHHPLVRRAQAALPSLDAATTLHARRCLYRRWRGLLLVTELFLPAIAQLMPRRLISTEPDRQ